MAQRQHLSKAFKEEAVRLLEQGLKPAANLARELGVRRNQLYKWQATLRREGPTAFPGSGRQAGAAAEITRLKKELARVTAERDVLKKAAVFFARDSEAATNSSDNMPVRGR
jgi:transposase